MSKKHFIELARHIRTHREAFSEEAIRVLARFCQSQNSAFMKGRWLAFIAGQCGENGGKVKA